MGPFELYTDVESTIEHYRKIRKLFKLPRTAAPAPGPPKAHSHQHHRRHLQRRPNGRPHTALEDQNGKVEQQSRLLL